MKAADQYELDLRAILDAALLDLTETSPAGLILVEAEAEDIALDSIWWSRQWGPQLAMWGIRALMTTDDTDDDGRFPHHVVGIGHDRALAAKLILAERFRSGIIYFIHPDDSEGGGPWTSCLSWGDKINLYGLMECWKQDIDESLHTRDDA